ncbi:hypothetical protein JXA56_03110 [Candidatus Micrarchaeota archaeon]|nr:hypothetical protein [Candidatus Micrarchaeota archaeon]
MTVSSDSVIMGRRDAKLYRDLVRPFCKGLLSGSPLVEVSVSAIGLNLTHSSRKNHVNRIVACGDFCYIFKAIMKEQYNEFQKLLADAYVNAVSKKLAMLEDNFEERMKIKHHVASQLCRIQLLSHSPEIAGIFDDLDRCIHNCSFVEITRID